MKISFLATLLLLTAPTMLVAQTTTVKTKTKTATAPTAKAKTAAPSAAPVATRPKVAPPEEQVEARANALTSNMQKALALNPEQAEKVRQINLTSVRGVETARLNYRQDVRKMAAIIDDIGQARLSTLKSVLTPAQFDKYQRKREEKMRKATKARPFPACLRRESKHTPSPHEQVTKKTVMLRLTPHDGLFSIRQFFLTYLVYVAYCFT
jgi:hypothetical protein